MLFFLMKLNDILKDYWILFVGSILTEVYYYI